MDIHVYSIGLNYCKLAKYFDYGSISEEEGHFIPSSLATGIKKLVTHKELAGKSGVIYGAAHSGKLTLEALKSHSSVSIQGFVDMKVKGDFCGLPVMHPIAADWGDFIIIAVNPSYLYSIFQCLKQYLKKDMDLLLLWEQPLLASGETKTVSLDSIVPKFPDYLGFDTLMALSNETDEWAYMDKKGRINDHKKAIARTVLLPKIKNDSVVVEIGPGFGIYARIIMEKLTKGELHLFETDEWWREYLSRSLSCDTTKIALHITDGKSLSGIADASVNLVFAGDVFAILPTMLMFNYLDEASRVLKKGGWLVFDIYDGDNVEDALNLIETSTNSERLYIALTSINLIKLFLGRRGLQLVPSEQNARFFSFQKKIHSNVVNTP